MDDVKSKLAEITRTIESARAMPMSASCVVNRSELLDQLRDLRALLPEAMTRAQNVLQDKDEVVEAGRREAAQIVEDARAEQARMLTEYEVYAAAEAEAERLVSEARASAESMRSEVDDYVDTKLANFEIVLAKTLRAVERGRQKLAGRDELAELDDEPEAQEIARG